MQKFGLKSNRRAIHSALEAQIVKEQASSLGRAGRKLRLSLDRYEALYRTEDSESVASVINEISNNVWELILQREFVGFIEGNLAWIESNYVIPEQALKKLGQRPTIKAN